MPATIKVPARLGHLHPLIAQTRAAAAGLKAGGDGRLMIGPQQGVLHIVVARPLLRRSLRIAQAVVAEAHRRSWAVEPFDGSSYGERPGVALVVRGHAYPVEIHEQTETLPFTEAEIDEWRRRHSWVRRGRELPPPQLKRKHATGRLGLLLPNGYRGGRVKWTEGPRGPLEGKLCSVFGALEQRANADDQRAGETARRAEELRREQAEHEAHARRLRIEQARGDRLGAELDAWELAGRSRRYTEALREKLPSLSHADQARIAAWCNWVEDRANRSDPVANPSLIRGLEDEKESFRTTGAGLTRRTA